MLIKAQDLAAIDTAMAELNTAFQAASAEMYAQSGAQGGAQAGQVQVQDNRLIRVLLITKKIFRMLILKSNDSDKETDNKQ